MFCGNYNSETTWQHFTCAYLEMEMELYEKKIGVGRMFAKCLGQALECITVALEWRIWGWQAALCASALLSLLALAILGNALALSALVRARRLASAHAMVASLAAADLLLALLVLPVSAARELFVFKLDPNLCLVWECLDVCCCTASILSLTALSWERHFGVTKPLKIGNRMWRARIMVGTIWFVSAVVSLPAAFVHTPQLYGDERACTVNTNIGYVFFSVFVSFYAPATVLVILYWRILRVIRETPPYLPRKHQGRATSPSPSASSRQFTPNSKILKDLKARTPTGCTDIRTTSDIYISPGGRHLVSPRRSRMFRSPRNSPSYFPTTWILGDLLSPCRAKPVDTSIDQLQRSSTLDLAESREDVEGEVSERVRQARATRTILLVVGGFLCCWMPFFIVLPLDAICQCVSQRIFTTVTWLGYANSALNPAIYAAASPQLRRTFMAVFRQMSFSSQDILTTQRANNSKPSMR